MSAPDRALRWLERGAALEAATHHEMLAGREYLLTTEEWHLLRRRAARAAIDRGRAVAAHADDIRRAMALGWTQTAHVLAREMVTGTVGVTVTTTAVAA